MKKAFAILAASAVAFGAYTQDDAKGAPGKPTSTAVVGQPEAYRLQSGHATPEGSGR